MINLLRKVQTGASVYVIFIVETQRYIKTIIGTVIMKFTIKIKCNPKNRTRRDFKTYRQISHTRTNVELHSPQENLQEILSMKKLHQRDSQKD